MFYMVASTSNPDSRWQPQTTAKPWIPSCQQPSCWDKQSRKIAWWLGGIKDFTNQVLLLVCSKPHTPVTRISWQNIRRLYLEHWSCSPAWLHTGAVKFDSCEAMQGEQHSFLEPVTITCLVWLKYSEKLILYTPWVSQYVAQMQPMRGQCVAYHLPVNRSKVKLTDHSNFCGIGTCPKSASLKEVCKSSQLGCSQNFLNQGSDS